MESYLITICDDIKNETTQEISAIRFCLIQAPMENRIQRVMTKQGLSREEAEKAIKKVDKMRENYVNKYTGTSRYDTRNYDLVITMDGKTEDEVADLIVKYIGWFSYEQNNNE